jgi:DNA-binding NarL/FixJ family response regulator
MPDKKKIIIVENHKLVRCGYVSLVSNLNAFEVVGEAKNVEGAVKLLQSVQADVILLDLEMSKSNVYKSLTIISSEFPALKVIVIGSHSEQKAIKTCLQKGASGYLNRNCDYDSFIAVLNSVSKTENISTVTEPDTNFKLKETGKGGLTKREAQVLIQVCIGKANKEIAENLNIEPTTVDFHKKNLYKKTGAYNGAGLYKYALQHGYVTGAN